jgi:hypothetical protein
VRPRSKAPAPHPAWTRGTCDERTDFAPFTFDRLFSAVVQRDGARKTAVGRSRRFTRMVAIAKDKGVVEGRKMRVDTTVVETKIHYPTDSSLLGDVAAD